MNSFMKTPLLKSNLITPSIVLAALLTAASLLVPFARAAEPPRLMPTGHGGGLVRFDHIAGFGPFPGPPIL
jgi:hypothetical protein